jgi:hypothetical protein
MLYKGGMEMISLEADGLSIFLEVVSSGLKIFLMQQRAVVTPAVKCSQAGAKFRLWIERYMHNENENQVVVLEMSAGACRQPV